MNTPSQSTDRWPQSEQHGPLATVPAILLTVKEAAGMLGVGRTMVYELIADGRLEVVHIGRCARVPVQSVVGLVDALRSHGAS
jgi:excisionase family DNA binding protein